MRMCRLAILLLLALLTPAAPRAADDLAELQAAVQRDPADAEAHVRLGDAYLRSKDGSSALREYRTALELRPVDVLTRTKLGTVLFAGRRFEEAEAEALKAAEIDPKRLEPLLLLAGADAALARWGDAADALRRAVRLAPDREALRVQLSSIYASQKDFAKAEAVLQEGLEAIPPSRALRAALVDVLAARERYAEADVLVAELLNLSPDDRHLNRTAGLYFLKRGDRARAEALLKKALRLADDTPTRVESLSDLANLHLAAGDFPAAQAGLEEARALAPGDVSVLIRLAKVYFVLRRPGDALEAADRALEVQPDSLDAKKVKAEALLTTGRAKEAEEEYRQLLAGAPAADAAALELRLGQALEAQNRLGEAFASYERSAGAAPTAAEPVLRQMAVLDRLGKGAEADGVALSFLRSAGDSGPLLATLSARALERRDAAAARRYVDRALAVDGESAAVRELDARVCLAEGNEPGARAALDAALAASPDRVSALVLLSGLLESQGKTGEARAANERILRLDPENVNAANNLAVLYARDPATRGEALRLARLAAARSPGNPYVLDTLGWVQYLSGDYQGATANLEAANRVVPAHQEIAYHLAAAYAKSGKGEKAAPLLKEALREAPEAAWVPAARALAAELGR